MSTQNPTGLELQVQAPEYTEQSVSMVQQYAQARIQSAYIVAAQRPRSIEAIRQGVLRECMRPSFCAPDESKNGSSLAIYAVPRGNVKDANGNWVANLIQGPTIRFAEMLLREWKYLSIEVNPMGEDEQQRLLQVICTDYQSCNWTSEIVTVPKTVERKKLKGMDEVIAQRTNSYGDPLYIVKATDDELAMRTNALVSKARRNLILQAVPGWLIEEGIAQVRKTARTKDAEDPDAARRKLYDAFASVGVKAEQLDSYLGHSNQLSPAELEDLRGFFSGIREGFTTWAAIVAAKEDGAPETGITAQIDDLLKELESTPAQIRNWKGKYVGQPEKLLAWLKEQAAKKKNDGGKREEKAKEADTAKTGTTETSTSQSTEQKTAQTEQKTTHRESAEPETQQDAKQSGPVEQEKPKSTPPAGDFSDW